MLLSHQHRGEDDQIMNDDEDEISRRMIRGKLIDLDVMHDFQNNASCIEVT
jgi:hypothetical protein